MAAPIPTIYSFMDVILTFVHPVAGTFTANGNIGAGRFIVTNTTDHTVMAVSSDGATMVSAVPGLLGNLAIEMQQTCAFHKFLLNWSNILLTALQQNDVSNWATASVEIRSVTDQSVHILTGVAPQKQADKTYEATGQNVTWNLPAATVLNS